MTSTIPRPAGVRRFAVQLRPYYMRQEKRLVLARFFWRRGTVGDGKGYSAKFSISICLAWYDLWIGLFYKKELWGGILYLCLLPCLPIRFHLKRAYGGHFF